MSIEYRIGDVFDRMREIPDGSIDLIVTSPPFLALRSYLPADHPDKAKEIGSEPTPAEFLDTLYALSAEWGRVLAPHGSICVELGDTFSGSGGAGGDYGAEGMRGGQAKFKGSALADRKNKVLNANGQRIQQGPGWPLAKSLTGIPTLYPWGLAYGRNLLTGQPHDAGQWRIRNLIVWARPNPPVGALGDKFRPATSYVTVACKGQRRYFDLDAVRTTPTQDPSTYTGNGYTKGNPSGEGESNVMVGNPAGAPPLDWHADDHPEDGDWLWKLSTQPYSGKVPTEKWVPIDRSEAEAAGVHADDIRRTASPDCPRHGGLPGQVPKALRDERAAAKSSRNGRNGDHPAQAQLDGFDTTDQPHDVATDPPTLAPVGARAATPHSTASRRTDHARSTNPPGTPSARTTPRTDDTSASPESSAPGHDTDESSTSPAGSAGSHDTQTSRDTAGTQAPEPIPCTCSFQRRTTEYTSHYATFPLTLPKRLIKAMCPLRVCTVCGKPSERIAETTNAIGEAVGRKSWRNDPENIGAGHTGTITRSISSAPTAERITTGWTDCGHDAWRTGIVLDPFAGSGTTLEAAQAVGRHAIGIDLDERNADLARERVGMFMEIAS